MNHKETIPDGASAPTTTDTTNPLDVQVGGSHYKQFPIQPAEFSERNGLTGLEFCVVKRVCRHSRGGKGRQDIEKAIHELQLLLEFHYPVSAAGDAQEAPVEAPANSADEDKEVRRGILIEGIRKYATGFSGHPADAGMWRSVIRGYLRSHPTTKKLIDLGTSDLRRLWTALTRAAEARARGALDIKISYLPAEGAGSKPGVEFSWTEPKTDPQNEKTDSENPKCEATDAKSEATPQFKPGDSAMIDGVVHHVEEIDGHLATVSTTDWAPYIVDVSCLRPVVPAKPDSATAEPPAAEPKSEATKKIEKGDLVTYRGESYRVHDVNAAYGDALIKPDLDPYCWITTDLFVPLGDLTLVETDSATAEPPAVESKPEAALKFKPGDGVYHRIRKTYGKVLQYPFGEGHLVGGLHFVAWTDGRNSVEHESDLLEEPQGAETQSEAPKVVNKLNVDIGAGYSSMAKTFVRAITSPTRLLGKHPALGARYELGQGDIAGLNSDSPFRAGGILDRGEAILPKGEEATAAGEAWTPKPGDKVRVVRKIKSHGGWNNYWVDLMDGAVGQVGRVKDFTDEDRRDNAVQLEFEGDPAWSDFWYPIPALERVTDAEG